MDDNGSSIRILRLDKVIDKTGLSRSTIYSWVEKDQFPRPVSLGPRAIGWVAGEIDAWLVQRRRIGNEA